MHKNVVGDLKVFSRHPQDQVLSTKENFPRGTKNREQETKTGDGGQGRRERNKGEGEGTKDYLSIERRHTCLIGKWQFIKVKRETLC